MNALPICSKLIRHAELVHQTKPSSIRLANANSDTLELEGIVWNAVVLVFSMGQHASAFDTMKGMDSNAVSRQRITASCLNQDLH